MTVPSIYIRRKNKMEENKNKEIELIGNEDGEIPEQDPIITTKLSALLQKVEEAVNDMIEYAEKNKKEEEGQEQ